ncbi:hypothetical protein MMC13_003082 [Lambiella insularis]|nr:hypothetical protein [Lambiella insularis]
MPPDHLYTPSSPLSPKMAPASCNASLSGLRSASAPRRGRDLQLGPLPLPRFHPAVYQSPTTDSASKITSVRDVPGNRPPRSPRSPQLHKREVSDAQQKLKQYQREIIANATRTSALFAAPERSATPKAPHITPLCSPGPATPLTLEDQGDYMTAGGRRLRQGSQPELIDNMIRGEIERGMGVRSGSTSPAVSPAGGP